MAENAAVLGELKSACEALKQVDATANWEWEGRFEAALSVYGTQDDAAVRGVLDEHFGNSWTTATLADAPAHLQRLVASLGGIRGGQELLTSDPGQDPMIAVALWPWGSGTKTSIRLWILTAGDAGELQAQLRSWLC